MLKNLKALVIIISVAGLVAGCSNSGGNLSSENNDSTGNETVSKDKVKIEFYQHKREAVEIYDQLIAEFEAANPLIEVEQNIRPDEPTYLKSRAAANDMPDVIGIIGGPDFKSFVDGGLLVNLDGTPQIDMIQPEFLEQIHKLSVTPELYAYPIIANAQTVLYNKKLFADAGLKPPTTWDEFIQLCEDIQAKGGQPLVFGYKDSWTTMTPVAQLSGQLLSSDYMEQLKAGKTTFKDSFREPLEKLLQMNKYGNKNVVEFGYDDANAQFALGKSYMYGQGIWAIQSVEAKNPEIEIGVFALPASSKSEDHKMIGTVDQFLSISSRSKHIEEARAFVNFLVEKETSQRFVTDQKLLPTIKGVVQNDPALSNLQSLIDQGSIAPFNLNGPAGFNLATFIQELLMKGDVDATLDALDKELQKIINR